jgi:hypothetical protein
MRSAARLPLSAALLALACSGGPAKKTEDKPKEPAPPTIAKETPKSEPAKEAPKSEPVSAPASQASTVIVFSADTEFLVPLGCYEASKKQLVKFLGENEDDPTPCLSLLPEGAMVAHSQGKSLATKGGGLWKCEPADIERKAALINIPKANELPWNEVAVWPETTPVTFFPRTENPDEAKVSLAPAESAALNALAKKEEPKLKKDLTFLQSVAVDIDGDGKEERFFSAFYPDDSREGGEPGFVFSAFLMAPGGDLSKLVVLQKSDFVRYELLAAVDLDGDGKRELVVHDFFYEGAGLTLYKLNGTNPERLGGSGCGA